MSQFTEAETPETLEAVRQVSQAVAAADFERAHDLADAALARGLVHFGLFNARALWLERQRRDEDALADFERAASLAPKNVLILNAIGLCLTRLGRLDEAVSAFDEAIRIDPRFTPSYQRKGTALVIAGDVKAARAAHEQAVRLNPRDAEALASLASIAARQRQPGLARDYAERALSIAPGHPAAIAAKALLANAEGRFQDSERLVRPIIGGLSGRARATALGLLADALDGQGRTGEAFEAYRQENDELRAIHAPRFAHLRSVADYVHGLSEDVRVAPPEFWQAVDDNAPCRHVFLLGFYRSGTTLLGQVLASHPDVVTLEERDFLLSPARRYLSDAAGLARLGALSDSELAAERAAYWRQIQDHGVAVGGKMFVDKHPFNTTKLPLIAKLFPSAKIIFAVRDPRDVVLSCFRRHFEINAAMYDLLTLDGAAALYDAAMQFADLMKPMFGNAFYTHRYEDMIEAFDAHVGALCGFLGLAFSAEMRNFHVTAQREDIRSPSAVQVTRALYDDAAGQWRRYRDEIQPVVPKLQHWIDAFGYPAA